LIKRVLIAQVFRFGSAFTCDGGGAPPDAGMSPEMGGAASTSGTSQTQSAKASSGASVTASVPSALVEAVIQSLQKKIAA
jgi:beta-glucanase (GH16 family)